MRTKHLSILLTLLTLIVFSAKAQKNDGKSIIEKHKIQEDSDDQFVNIKMTLVNKKGKERVRSMKWTRKTDELDNNSTLIQFKTPADVKGTGFVSIEYADREDDRWLFLPALKRSRRISSSNDGDNFMGSDYYYEDLDGEDLDDYNYELLGEDKFNGIECYKIKAVAKGEKAKTSSYKHRELWVRKDTYLIPLINYYDKNGTLTKKLTSSDMKKIDGSEKYRFMKSEMVNLSTDHKTILSFDSYVFDQGIDKEVFSKRHLEESF